MNLDNKFSGMNWHTGDILSFLLHTRWLLFKHCEMHTSNSSQHSNTSCGYRCHIK